jgi:hypothetical protein
MLQAEIAKNKCSALVVASLDEVAWTFNLRGADITFNPGMLRRGTLFFVLLASCVVLFLIDVSMMQ